jgi:hypothetical protein
MLAASGEGEICGAVLETNASGQLIRKYAKAYWFAKPLFASGSADGSASPLRTIFVAPRLERLIRQ